MKAIPEINNTLSLKSSHLDDTKNVEQKKDPKLWKAVKDFESILISGKVTVINTFHLRDVHQRIVGLYLLTMLHKRALKSKEMINVVFFLDEIQRLLPKSKFYNLLLSFYKSKLTT